MLKKIVLVALFVASATVAAAGTVFAHPAQKAPGAEGAAAVLPQAPLLMNRSTKCGPQADASTPLA